MSTLLVVHFFQVKISSCRDFKMSRCVVQDVEMLNTGGVHAHSCIMAGWVIRARWRDYSKICIGIQSQLILPEFIYLMLSL